MNTTGVRFASGLLLIAILVTGCRRAAIDVEYRAGYAFSRAERAAIETVADRAVADVRVLLPDLPSDLRITVQAGSDVIPETGETGTIGLPGAVYWTVDPARDGGVKRIVDDQLRATLFHEWYHLTRASKFVVRALLDRVVDEGLATKFERDFGGRPTPWGAYTDEVEAWTDEVLALPADAPFREWMYRHSDGRRWIGMRVGTYLADLASLASGLSVAQLAAVPTEQVISWAASKRPARPPSR